MQLQVSETDANYNTYKNYIETLENMYYNDANPKPYGFMVLTGKPDGASTSSNYAAWVEMLSKGYRIYATAGRDTHADLYYAALTSIYAETCAGCATGGSCTSESCAKSDKGNLIPQLQSGDFVAGNVGIQMIIGNTKMGGSCDFTNQRLIVGIGEIHQKTREEYGEKYRVDILNEHGVVYSQQITAGEATTIALNTIGCNFYRLEVYSASGVRIAIGNPIWNDK